MSKIGQGGEGSQWPRGDLAVSATDPNFLLLPIDVGGIYRSLDGGVSWNIAMNGWNARGANGMAIDPKNSSRALGVGGNSMNWDLNWGQSPHGIYLSTDKAGTWRQVAARPDGFGGSLAYDATSYDKKLGFCTRVYYLSASGNLFRSDNGGENWGPIAKSPITPSINRDWTLGGLFTNCLRVSSTTGSIWISGKDGVFCSKDQGETFQEMRSGPTYGLDLSPNGTVWISDATGVSRSEDGGNHWLETSGHGLDLMGQFVANVHVSPANPRELLAWVPGENWQWKRYVSSDGGEDWQEAKLDKSLAILPSNARQGYFTWHPTNPRVAWSIGGDWVSKSTDGGHSFQWSNNGYNGVMLGSSFNFSTFAPNTVLLGFQDYNGAFTTDGGVSWNYRDLSGLGWGGHAYGAGQVNSKIMWFGEAQSWNTPRHLKISRDGGTSWSFVLGADGKALDWQGADVSFVDPNNPNILFASNFRSIDQGLHWTSMAECDSVYTASKTSLIGEKGDAIVTSGDGGATWKVVTNATGGFRDVAYDEKRHRFLVASEGHLKVWDGHSWTTLETPPDQYGQQNVETVALDPQDSDIIYAAGARNTYATSATVVRSTDSGLTWENLTKGEGPHEVQWLRVHPVTRQLWAAGQCFGMWRLDAPTKKGRGNPEPADAARSPALPVIQSYEELHPPLFGLRNGSMDDVKEGVPQGWTQMWMGSGKLRAVWDTENYKVGPASFRLDTDGTNAKGQCGEVVDAFPGAKFRVGGWIKSHGNIGAQVAIQAMRDDWSPISFQSLKTIQNDSGWQEFSGEVVLPPETKRFNLVLFVEGTGTAWLDEVSLSDVPRA